MNRISCFDTTVHCSSLVLQLTGLCEPCGPHLAGMMKNKHRRRECVFEIGGLGQDEDPAEEPMDAPARVAARPEAVPFPALGDLPHMSTVMQRRHVHLHLHSLACLGATRKLAMLHCLWLVAHHDEPRDGAAGYFQVDGFS